MTLLEEAFSLPLLVALKMPLAKVWRPGASLFRFGLAPEFSFHPCLTDGTYILPVPKLKLNIWAFFLTRAQCK